MNRDVAWTDTRYRKVAGYRAGHHNSDRHEGVEGGLRISRNKKSRWRETGTQGIVMATCFQLLHVGAVVGLRNFVAFIKKKKKVFNMMRVQNRGLNILTLHICFWFH